MSTITTSSFDWSARHGRTASKRSVSQEFAPKGSAARDCTSAESGSASATSDFASARSGVASAASGFASAASTTRPQVSEAIASQMAAAIGGVGGASGLTLFGGAEQLFADVNGSEGYWALPAGRVAGLRKIVHRYSLVDADLPDDDPGASDALLPVDRISA